MPGQPTLRDLINVDIPRSKIKIMRWITRERPKIDRIACPWLIKNFVDNKAEFIYVQKEHVFSQAEKSGAIPYDIPALNILTRVNIALLILF